MGVSADKRNPGESNGLLNGLTSSLNWFSCRIPYQTLHSLNALPSVSEKALFFTDFISSHPLPVPSRPHKTVRQGSCDRYLAIWGDIGLAAHQGGPTRGGLPHRDI